MSEALKKLLEEMDFNIELCGEGKEYWENRFELKKAKRYIRTAIENLAKEFDVKSRIATSNDAYDCITRRIWHLAAEEVRKSLIELSPIEKLLKELKSEEHKQTAIKHLLSLANELETKANNLPIAEFDEAKRDAFLETAEELRRSCGVKDWQIKN